MQKHPVLEETAKQILRFFSKQINPRFFVSWCAKGTEESTLEVDSSTKFCVVGSEKRERRRQLIFHIFRT